MQAKFVPPSFRGNAFTCVFCQTLTPMEWGDAMFFIAEAGRPDRRVAPPFAFCRCATCGRCSIWQSRTHEMLLPDVVYATEPHEDLPEDCQSEYEEARQICTASPRGAAAILRLCLQKLLVHLGGKGEHIDTDIKVLVQQGLDIHIQQALDVIRVTGNNAVHPLEMNLEDDPETVNVLFDMVNLIVEERISRPKRIKAAFDKLPEKARQAIERRDTPK